MSAPPTEHAPGWPYLTDEELERAREQWPAGVPLPVRAWRSRDWRQVRYMLGSECRKPDGATETRQRGK